MNEMPMYQAIKEHLINIGKFYINQSNKCETKMNNLKQQIEWCLQNIPNTRDSDIKLTLNVWKKFYPQSIHEIEGEYYVKIKDMYDLPREDNVKRIRAKFNEEGKYLTDKLEIRKKRKQLEQVWRKELGY